MGTYFGDKKISQMYYGDQKIKEAYYGSDLVYSSLTLTKKTFKRLFDKYYSLVNENTIYRHDIDPPIRVGPSGTVDFNIAVYLNVPNAWGKYTLYIVAGDKEIANVTKEGASTIFVNKTLVLGADLKNISIPPNTDVLIKLSRSGNTSTPSRHGYDNLDINASWTEANRPGWFVK